VLWSVALGCGEPAADEDASGSSGAQGAGTGAAAGSASGSGAAASGGTNAASAGEGGSVAASAPDLPPPLPPCATAPGESDAGVSPYDGTCVDERVGVFASPEGDVAPRADGSRSRPFRSLQDAVGLAVREGRDVYACAGTYEGALQIGTELSDGLKLFGGLSCDGFAAPDPSGARSVVHALGEAAALRVDSCHGVVVERFELHADRAEMPKPGATYVAASITNALGVELRDVVLRTADGEAGEDGEPPEAKAADGADADDGQDACSRNPNPGGAGALQTACGGASTSFASGGTGGLAGVGTGDAGGGFQQSFLATQGETGGTSGTWSCAQGTGSWYPPGMSGQGTVGRGGRGFGALLGGRFIGYAGAAGSDGPAGAGGVGGGGARAPASCSGLASAVGASGGGGGGGGCGGAGGGGGGAGGSSIALLVLDGEVIVRGGELHVGRGGAGGDGAAGQAGGAGGNGGKGGEGSGSSSDACDGTDGGDGGLGGPGGGGNGGHALGVLFDGPMPELEDVAGELETASEWGGAAGEGPADVTEPLSAQLVGTPGVTAWVREF
jgi:hypothetical protein